MANDNDVRRLMEHILPNFQSCLVSNPTEIVIPDSFIPKGPITKEFFATLKIVLSTKLLIIEKLWGRFCSISLLNALSSHEMYLRYVLFACDIQLGLTDNIFETFLVVCALIITFIQETLDIAEVDFSNVAVDIVMEFYQSSLKAKLCSQGGFKRFAIFISEDYNIWRTYFRDDIPVEKRISFMRCVLEEIRRKTLDDSYKPEYNTHGDVLKNNRCLALAKQLFLSTKMKLPPLPNSEELKTRIRDNRIKRTAISRDTQKAPVDNQKSEVVKDNLKPKSAGNLQRELSVSDVELETPAGDVECETPAGDVECETPAGDVECETPAGDFKPKNKEGIFHTYSNFYVNAIKQNANSVWCENIFRAVVKHNNAKSPGSLQGNNRFYQEAENTMNHLKNKISTLIAALDEYDEEINF